MAQSYKIPQNVDLEDKIFGPFTLKQFLYLLAAGIVTFISFSTFFSILPVVFYLITFVTWLATAAFVFVRPNEQTFAKFVTSFIWFTTKPQRRTWRRIPTLDQIKLQDEAPEVDPTPPEPNMDEVRSRLARLAHVVDTRGWSDVDEPDVAARINSGEAKPEYNVSMTQSEQDELAADDVLASEDEEVGPSRATHELDRMLKDGVPRPDFSHDTKVKQAARHAENGV
jgi:hypothetical protein